MPKPDGLAGLAADFDALPRRQRRSVLDSLSRSERTKFKVLLSCARAQAEPQDRETAAWSHGLPPSLRERLPGDGNGGQDVQHRWKMTAAARLALHRSAQLLLDGAEPQPHHSAPVRRSLVGAFGDLLVQGRGVR